MKQSLVKLSILTLLFTSISCEEPVEFPAEFAIYPNPFRDFFRVEVIVFEESQVTLKVVGTDYFQESIISMDGDSGQNDFNFRMEGNDKEGTYILEVSVNGIVRRTKIWKY